MIAPPGIGRRTAAARIRSVDDVIMNQRGAMNQLDDSAKANRAVPPIARIPCRKQQQGGTQPLAPSAQQVARNFRDRLDRRVILERKLLLDLGQVVANEIEDFLRRQE
jgi:hypothetical protein